MTAESGRDVATRQRTERVQCLVCGGHEFRAPTEEPNTATTARDAAGDDDKTRVAVFRCANEACPGKRELPAYTRGSKRTVMMQVGGLTPDVDAAVAYGDPHWGVKVLPLEDELVAAHTRVTWLPAGERDVDSRRTAFVFVPEARYTECGQGTPREVWVVDDNESGEDDASDADGTGR